MVALSVSQGAFGVFAMTFGAPFKEPMEKSVEAEFAVGESGRPDCVRCCAC